MISTNNYICFVIIKTQIPGDCNLGPTISPFLMMTKHMSYLKNGKNGKELGGTPSNHAIYEKLYT